MDTGELNLIGSAVVGFLIGVWILWAVIKSAVKQGINESDVGLSIRLKDESAN